MQHFTHVWNCKHSQYQINLKSLGDPTISSPRFFLARVHLPAKIVVTHCFVVWLYSSLIWQSCPFYFFYPKPKYCRTVWASSSAVICLHPNPFVYNFHSERVRDRGENSRDLSIHNTRTKSVGPHPIFGFRFLLVPLPHMYKINHQNSKPPLLLISAQKLCAASFMGRISRLSSSCRCNV